jgi:two-component system, cell cycle response regulator CpdR
MCCLPLLHIVKAYDAQISHLRCASSPWHGLTKSRRWLIERDMVKILLAEDDDDLRRFLVKALEKAGHRVTPFAEGASAYEEIKQDSFDLLLTDIVMPEMDGIELARRAAELDPSLKIMFITGFAAVALNPDSKAPKDAKVLSKPFHLRDLVDEVNRLMAA